MRVLCCVLFFCMNCLLAEIIQIEQISDIKKISLEPKAWVFFDIDYTLTKPSNRALENFKQDRRFRELLAQCSIEQRRILPSIVILQTPNVLVSSDIPELLTQLQEDGHTILGCTSSFSHIGTLPEWREKELNRLRITFTQKGSPKVFDQFVSYRGTYPLFQKGVLYTNTTTSKGDAVVALLEHLDERPPQIVLVDDTLDNLRSVEWAMERRRIPFLGIQFVPPQEERTISDQEWYEVWDPIHKRVQEETSHERR